MACKTSLTISQSQINQYSCLFNPLNPDAIGLCDQDIISTTFTIIAQSDSAMDLGAKGYALVWNLHYRRGQGNFRKNNTASKGSGKLNGGGLDRLFEDTVSRLHLRDTSPRSYHGLGGCIETRLERVNIFIKPRFSTVLLIVVDHLYAQRLIYITQTFTSSPLLTTVPFDLPNESSLLLCFYPRPHSDFSSSPQYPSERRCQSNSHDLTNLV